MTFRSLVFLLSLAVAAPPAQSQRSASSQKPTLVVFITADQMRGDYYARFQSQLTGGLKTLMGGGAFYRNGFQDHAITETAPGHASTMSGRFPVHTGITSNAQGVGMSEYPLLGGATETGAAPLRFQGTTLTDWMRAADSSMRFLSVSRKDRSAILPIGRTKGDVYWWSGSAGIFTTSRYYADSLAPWVQAFNTERGYAAYAGKAWHPLLPSEQYVEKDSVPQESNGADFLFPHAFPGDHAAVARNFANYPMMDSLTLAFALRGVQVKGLGADANRTDVLAISLSATDAIGHKYGPDSRELHDQIVRLDRYLGAFLDSLFTLRDRARILIALTGDHGVSPFPDVHTGRYPNQDARRVNVQPQIQQLSAALAARGITMKAWEWDDGVFILHDSAAFAQAHVDADSILRAFARTILSVPGVMRADMVTDLAHVPLATDTFARRWLHMFAPGGPAKLVVTLTPYSYWSHVNYATHGSPHDADAGVPIVFWGAGVKSGQYERVVRTVDIAPTLAAILRITPTEPLDGVVLKDAMRRAR